MTFALATPGAPSSLARRPKPPLAPIVKTSVLPGPRGPQTWAAESGEWLMRRLEDAATSWEVMHKPTKTVVADFLGSLRQCRLYVGSGEAAEDLKEIQARAKDRLAPGDGELCFYCTSPAYVRDRGRMVCEGHDGCAELAGDLRNAPLTVVSGSIGFGDGRDGITRIDERGKR